MRFRLYSLLIAGLIGLTGGCFLFSPAVEPPTPYRLTLAELEAAPALDGRESPGEWPDAGVSVPLVNLATGQPAASPALVKVARHEKHLFVLVSWADPTPSDSDRSWIWDPEREIYVTGEDREDILAVSLGFPGEPFAVCMDANEPFRADLWLWAACRTNPSGYADDRQLIVAGEASEDAPRRVDWPDRPPVWMGWPPDKGLGCFEFALRPTAPGKLRLPYYGRREPTGGRRDVRARGEWREGRWTVEFKRRLDTGNREHDAAARSGSPLRLGLAIYDAGGRHRPSALIWVEVP